MPECSGTSQRGIFSTRSVASGTPKEGLEIKCHSDTLANKLYILLRVSPKALDNTIMNLATAMGAWVHCTVVWSVGSDLIMYENGHHLNTGSIDLNNGQWYNNTDPGMMVFGRHYTNGQHAGANDYSTGFVDGVKIYNRPLNATEVLMLYNSNENEY